MSTESSYMLRCALAAVIVALVAATAAWGQVAAAPAVTEAPAPAVEETHTPPFVGRMWAKDATSKVRVRCGPGTAYYPVCLLKVGTEVTVTADDGTWKALLPPPGCFSLITTKHVTVDPADATVGKVTGNSVNIRAFPFYTKNFKNPERHTSLNTGDTVKIVGKWNGTLDGEQHEFYKIAPPTTVRVYVSSEFCKFDRAFDPTVARAGQPDVVPAATDLTPKKFDNLEKALRAACGKPSVEKIDPDQLKDLAARYQAIADGTSNKQIKANAVYRVKWINQRLALIDAYHRALQAEAAIDRRLERATDPAPPLRPVESPQPLVKKFTAVGRIQVGVFTEQYPTRFRLVGPGPGGPPGGDQTLCYVEAVPDGPDLKSLLGKRIGVIGTKNYNTTWRQYLIFVREAEVIEKSPATPKPTTRPAVP